MPAVTSQRALLWQVNVPAHASCCWPVAAHFTEHGQRAVYRPPLGSHAHCAANINVDAAQLALLLVFLYWMYRYFIIIIISIIIIMKRVRL